MTTTQFGLKEKNIQIHRNPRPSYKPREISF